MCFLLIDLNNCKWTVNAEHNDKNLNKTPKRTRAKESQVIVIVNNCNSFNTCNRPTTTTNSQNYLIKSKRPTTLVNRRAENQDISERKKVVPQRQNFSESKKKKSNDIVIFGNSITNYSRYQKIFPIKNLLNCQSDINQINYILQNIEHIIYIRRQFDLKNILSQLTITNRLPEQLIKDFNILIGIICRRSILILEIMQTSS